MTITVSLDVMLKGIDLVADTAFLTLRGKMGYANNLLGIKRLDAYGFRFESGNPPETLSRLRRLLNTQTLFYNRNKHNYSLVCRWDGGGLEEGVPVNHPHRQLDAQARRFSSGTAAENFRSVESRDRGMLINVPVFRTEVLVENLDPSAKETIARKLEDELSVAPVILTVLGTRWHLALRVPSREEAIAVTEAIVVTERRDRGFLLNPNYQGFHFVAAEAMEFGD